MLTFSIKSNLNLNNNKWNQTYYWNFLKTKKQIFALMYFVPKNLKEHKKKQFLNEEITIFKKW